MSKFFPTSGFKWIDPKEFNLNIYTSNSSKGFVLKVDLEYPKELCRFYNNYPVASDKIEIKRQMRSKYQLKIIDLYNIPIGNVKNLCLTFLIKKSMCFIIKTCNLRLELKPETIYPVLEFSQSQCLKPYIEFNTHKRIEAEKNEDRDGKHCTN